MARRRTENRGRAGAMNGLYKVVDADGKITFSDRPEVAAGGRLEQLRQDGLRKADDQTAAQKDFDTARQDIGLARKHIPNVVQYLEYLDYLRVHSPIRFDRLMKELQHEDPKLWLKLQKYPQFQPLGKTLGVSNAGGNLLSLGVALGKGDVAGGFGKWGESTLKDLMKRDGYYADVLGSKASTLPQPPKSTYSHSRLGRYLAQEVPRQDAAAKAAAKELEAGRAALRTGAATAFSRVGGTVLDVEMAALNPDRAQDAAVIVTRLRMLKLVRLGALEADDELPQQLLSQGKYVELKKYLDDAETSFVRGR
jgi:hypothetical protein